MKKINPTYKNLLIIAVVVTSLFTISKTMAVGNSFRAGETLDPSCGPLDPLCTVRLLDLYKEKPGNGAVNIVTGDNAIAIGSGNTASGNAAIAIGQEFEGDPGALASGDYSVAIGHGSVAAGYQSSALGAGAVATGEYSTAVGYMSQAVGSFSSAFGVGTYAPSFAETSFGSYPAIYTPVSDTAWNANDLIFSVGNGLNGASRSTALSVSKNGNTTANGNLTVNGDFTIADTVNEIPAFNSEISFRDGNITTNDGIIQVGGGGIRFRLQPMGSPAQEFTLDARLRKDAILLPRGTTEERDEDSNGDRRSVPAGAIRYNTDLNAIEITKAEDDWVVLGESEGGSAFNIIKENSDLSDSKNVAPEPNGLNSIAIGLGTLTSAAGEISMGTYPLTGDNYGGFAPQNLALSVGVGADLSNQRNAMVILRNGQVGIGNITQGNLLNASQVSILTDTGAFLSSDGTWTSVSDQSLKTNVSNLNYGLNELKMLQPRSFNFIRSGKPAIGFIAQEVESIIPEIVSDSGLGTKGVEYGQLTAVLVNAIQELEERVAYLESSGGQRASERQQEEIVVLDPAQEASLIKSSNDINLTNILLMLMSALLIINLIAVGRRIKVK